MKEGNKWEVGRQENNGKMGGGEGVIKVHILHVRKDNDSYFVLLIYMNKS